MFEQLSLADKRTVFKALRTLIESDLGRHEFYNGDKSHPYLSCRGMYHATDVQATPDDSPLYLMLSELSAELKDAGDIDYVWWYDFTEWDAFCRFCHECQQKDVFRNNRESQNG